MKHYFYIKEIQTFPKDLGRIGIYEKTQQTETIPGKMNKKFFFIFINQN